MRTRALLTIVALVLCAGCGTTGGGGSTDASTGDKGSTTTTSAEADPSGTDGTEPDATEPDGGPIASIDEEDLERVLPEATDLPEGWADAPVPEDDDVKTEYSPSIGCEAMAEWLGRDIKDEKTFTQRSFKGPNGFGLNLTITNAPDELKTLFTDIGVESTECEQIRATSDDGYAATAFMAPGPFDLGDESFYNEMHVVADGQNFPPTGITLIGVLHGDVTFRVQLVDGLDDAGTRFTRDPMVARQVAQQIDDNLDLLLGE